MVPRIFISYCHADIANVDEIEETPPVKANLVEIVRDKKSMEFQDTISEFMKKIRDAEFALIYISKPYLQSPACMGGEILELLKEKDFENKVIFIVLDGAEIYGLGSEVPYVEYWDVKVKQLRGQLARIPEESKGELGKDLRRAIQVRDNIADFINLVKDRFNIPIGKLRELNYMPVWDRIGLRGDAPDNYLSELTRVSNIKDEEEQQIALDDYRKQNGETSYTLLMYGHVMYERKKFKLARIKFDDAVALDPDNIAAMNSLATLLWERFDNYDRARELYESVLEKDPDNIEANINLGVILVDHYREYSLAIKFFEKVRKVGASDETLLVSYINQGNALLKSPDFDGAKEQYEKALLIRPDDPVVNLNLGVLLRDHYRDYAKAKTYLEKAWEADKQNPVFMVNLAKVLIILKEEDRSRALLEEALKYEPKNAIAKINLAGLLELHYKEHDAAIKHYEELIEIDPKDEDACMALGRALQSVGEDPNLPIKRINELIEKHPDSPALHYTKAALLTDVYQDSDGAFNELLRVLELSPLHTDARLKIAKIYVDRSEYERAVDEYKVVLENDKDNPYALHNLGAIYLDVFKDKENANKYFRLLEKSGRQNEL